MACGLTQLYGTGERKMRKILIQSLLGGMALLGGAFAAQAGGACPCEDCVLASGTSATRDDAMADARAASASPDLCSADCVAKTPLSMALVPASAENQQTRWSISGACVATDDGGGGESGASQPSNVMGGSAVRGIAGMPGTKN